MAVKYISDRDNRNRLRLAGVTPTTPLVVAEWTTPVSEVHAMLRVQDGSEKVLVVIRRAETLYTLMASADEPQQKHFLKSTDLHEDAEIGMIYDALSTMHRGSPIPAPPVDSIPGRKLGQYSLTPA